MISSQLSDVTTEDMYLVADKSYEYENCNFIIE